MAYQRFLFALKITTLRQNIRRESEVRKWRGKITWMGQAVGVCFSAGFSNRNKSFKNQHTRRDGIRRSKDAPSIIGRNLFAHFHPSEDSSVFHPIPNLLSHLRLRIMHISRWPRRGNMDGIFILSLRRSAQFSKTSGKDERGSGGRDETACDEIEGGFHSCGLTQREGQWSWMSLRWSFCYTFIYLSKRSKTHRLAQAFVSRKKISFCSSHQIGIPRSFLIYWIYLSLNTWINKVSLMV